jgi:UDP-N-acetylglucosamine 2-epimerase (non-hydrolysing)
MPAKVICVAGARPNFMKIAPILRALRARPDAFEARLVHTGQHYDDKLSAIFFDELRIPRPDVELEVGSASHAVQAAKVMLAFEPVLQREQPQCVLVVGDVNSTIACALVTSKFVLDEPFHSRFGARRRPLVVHVEAGLRSFDDDMPEEINRKLTDAISEVLFVSDPAGVDNLRREGVDEARIHFVGNVMIDTLLAAREQAMRSPILETLGVAPQGYGLVTLHRPSNVDDAEVLRALLTVLDQVAERVPLVFPVHPRTRSRLDALGFSLDPARWKLIDPVGYLDFVKLMSGSRVILTDSGGIQEESTVLGVPCLTLRENTERPVTISEGTNFLAGTTAEGIRAAFDAALTRSPVGRMPRFWDGSSAERIADELQRIFAR